MVVLENYERHHQNWEKRFNDTDLSDVVFEASDGQTFHCEKFVLEVASPYFKKLFAFEKCDNPGKTVAVKDVDPAALKWIPRACYTGDGEVDEDNVVSVMLAAATYEMDWVEKACIKYLKGGIKDLKEDKAGPLAIFHYAAHRERWQEWVVPESGWYHMAAMGAKAVDQPDLGQPSWSRGGMGAMIGGSFELQVDSVVQILTGGMSRLWMNAQEPNVYSGGGGGTFVAVEDTELSLCLLLAAGGGGSIDHKYCGGNGDMDESGTSADPKTLGGRDGGNGDSNGMHKGGLGWNAGAAALAMPRGADVNDNGGFGGGGNICGGGGGYSGGSPGNYGGAGGGGSYVASQAENIWKKVGSLGHGKVVIWKGKDAPAEAVFLS